jgi:signal transduction histidine kinase
VRFERHRFRSGTHYEHECRWFCSEKHTWTVTGQPHGVRNFETVLLAIAGHDLRRPLQIIQSAHELLAMGIRTKSKLRCLRWGQNAIDRIKEQLTQLLTAFRIREHRTDLELAPVRVQQFLGKLARMKRRRCAGEFAFDWFRATR